MQKMRTTALQQMTAIRSVSFLVIAAKVAAIAAVVLALYNQDLIILFTNALQDEATTHILVIPPIFAFLIYRKRKILRAVIPNQKSNPVEKSQYLPTLCGFLLCLTAIILYWYGSYTFTPLEYHILTLPLLTAGLTLGLFNIQTIRELAIPVTFLVFLTPPPVEILYGLGSLLSVYTAEASNAIVNLLGIPSTISGDYGNPTITLIRPDRILLEFTVDVACSGIYSLIGFVVFASFIAYATRHKNWIRLAILFLGLPLIAFLNLIRISIILWIGYNYGEQLALQIFHIVGGLLLICIATAIVLIITEKILKKPQPPKPCLLCTANLPDSTLEACPNCGKLLKYPKIRFRKNDLAKIIVVAVVVAILLLYQVPVFALTKSPAPIIVQTSTGEQGNTEILPQIQGYNLQFMYRDKAFEQKSKQDASLIYSYTSNDPTKRSVIVALELATTTTSLHRWETCLITWPQTHGYQPKVAQLDLRDTQIMQNPPITARYFAFQYAKTNQTQLVLYWYENSIFTFNGTAQQKKAKISLITYPRTPQEIQQAASQLEPFAVAVAAYWQPLHTWSQVYLFVSHNGLALAAASTALTATTFSSQTFVSRQKRKSLYRLYSKLPPQDKLVVDAVYQASHAHKPTTDIVASHLQKLTGTDANTEIISRKLKEAENAGLVERKICNMNDEPIVFWKNCSNLKR